MAVSDRLDLDEEIEHHILAVLCASPRVTFTTLADAVPEYRWGDLFRALNRLRDRRQVELSTLPWDYEVLLSSPGGRRHKA